MDIDVNLVIEKLMKQMNDLILKNTMLEIQLEQLQKVEGGDESEE